MSKLLEKKYNSYEVFIMASYGHTASVAIIQASLLTLCIATILFIVAIILNTIAHEHNNR